MITILIYYGQQRRTKTTTTTIILYECRLMIIMKAVHYRYATVTQLTREMCGSGAAGGCYVTAGAYSLVINKWQKQQEKAERGAIFSQRKLHNMTATCLNANKRPRHHKCIMLQGSRGVEGKGWTGAKPLAEQSMGGSEQEWRAAVTVPLQADRNFKLTQLLRFDSSQYFQQCDANAWVCSTNTQTTIDFISSWCFFSFEIIFSSFF